MVTYPSGFRYYNIDTGYLENTDTEPKRLFDITLSASDERGTPEILVLTGTELGSGSFIRLRDPKRPEWHKDFDWLWEGRVLFFQVHGNSVIVELWGAPGSRNRLRIEALHWVRYDSPIQPASDCGICCGSDDRIPSSAGFVGRLKVVRSNSINFCSAFLAHYGFQDCTLLFTAGHCLVDAVPVLTRVQFNVPPSQWSGGQCLPLDPPEEHTFPILRWQSRYEAGGPDWGVMVPGTNSEGLTPYQKYGDRRMMQTDIGEHLIWSPAHNFGYGADDKPWQCERHLTQQYGSGRIITYSASGPYTIDFAIDIRPGSSGSPLLESHASTVVGIVTHCRVGCPNIAHRPDDWDVISAYWDLCRCPGDVNGDRVVDDADMLSVLMMFGESCWFCPEDLNGDGIVDDGDILIVLVKFGTVCP